MSALSSAAKFSSNPMDYDYDIGSEEYYEPSLASSSEEWYEEPALSGVQEEFYEEPSFAGTRGRWLGREKLVAAEQLPIERIREVDVITRKKVPYHEVREVYEGPASTEIYETPVREYVNKQGFYTERGAGLFNRLKSRLPVAPTAYGAGTLKSNLGYATTGYSTAPVGRVPLASRIKSRFWKSKIPISTGYSTTESFGAAPIGYPTTATTLPARIPLARRIRSRLMGSLPIPKTTLPTQARSSWMGKTTKALGHEKLVAAQRLPGERIREVDLITRKKIPYHEVREVFEGPASTEMYESPVREYVNPSFSMVGRLKGRRLARKQMLPQYY